MSAVLIAGLGISGIASARFLIKTGAAVVLFDDNREKAVRYAVELGCDIYNENAPFPDYAVVSPGIPDDHPLVARLRRSNVPVIGDVELAARFIPDSVRVVAVTGTNGKSTTVSLLRDLFESLGFSVFLCGNIGEPVVNGIGSDKTYDFFVIELSSFQLDTISSLRVDVGVLLNITADHLDRYADMNEYTRSKMNLFRLIKPEGRAVCNSDFVDLSAITYPKDVRSFSSERQEDAVCKQGKVTALRASAVLTGSLLEQPHNADNTKAALLAVDYFIGKPHDFTDVIQRFSPLSHRVELVAEHDGVVFYDDSKGTNTGATVQALRGFPDNSVVLLLGGVDKGGGYADVRMIAEQKCKAVVVFGEAAPIIKNEFSEFKVVASVNSMQEAVTVAFELARPNGVVLLSPACSSFDWYANYRERGEDFARTVRAVIGREI